MGDAQTFNHTRHILVWAFGAGLDAGYLIVIPEKWHLVKAVLTHCTIGTSEAAPAHTTPLFLELIARIPWYDAKEATRGRRSLRFRFNDASFFCEIFVLALPEALTILESGADKLPAAAWEDPLVQMLHISVAYIMRVATSYLDHIKGSPNGVSPIPHEAVTAHFELLRAAAMCNATTTRGVMLKWLGDYFAGPLDGKHDGGLKFVAPEFLLHLTRQPNCTVGYFIEAINALLEAATKANAQLLLEELQRLMRAIRLMMRSRAFIESAYPGLLLQGMVSKFYSRPSARNMDAKTVQQRNIAVGVLVDLFRSVSQKKVADGVTFQSSAAREVFASPENVTYELVIANPATLCMNFVRAAPTRSSRRGSTGGPLSIAAIDSSPLLGNLHKEAVLWITALRDTVRVDDVL